MKRYFYFFRHGQRVGVEIDSTLDEIGIAQAKKLAEFLSDKNIQIVYSSPLRRSIDTAKIAINNPNLEIITDDRLIETTFGFWYSDEDPRQQRIKDNFNRIKSCLNQIIETDNHSNIAISSHGGVTRALCWACGYKVDEVKMCQCFCFSLDDNEWKFLETFYTGIKGRELYHID